VHFEGAIARRLADDPASTLGMVAPWFESADLAMVNLETAVTERGTPAHKQYVFRAPATAIDALRAGGVDVASMANNHGLDYGPDGLEDSLATAFYTGFPIIGIGHDEAEAYRPYETTIKGQRIAVIAATQVLDEELIPDWTATPDHPGLASAKRVDRLVQAVTEARARSDTLVVYLHWGTERQTCPNTQQRELAQQLADAGADIVVGGHAHRVLAGGRLGNTFVNYGLGNFMFFAPDGGASAQGGVLTITVTGRHVDDYRWQPTETHGGIPQPVSEEIVGDRLEEWGNLRECAGLAP
jgi:poly-gamma-glutamate synthesis protein (capsule biosynthesis protein)